MKGCDEILWYFLSVFEMFEIEEESISQKSIYNLILIDFNIIQINIPIAKQLKKSDNKYHKNKISNKRTRKTINTILCL